MKVFIGSSSEQKDLANKVASWLEDMNEEPILWCDDTTFKLTRFTWNELVRIAHSVDAAIFIFAADDKIWLRGKEKDTVRDNVILEYGLFSGILSENNVCFIRSGDSKLPSDLSGVTYADITKQHSTKIQIKEWIKSISPIKIESQPFAGLFKHVSLGNALTSILQCQTEFEKVRVFAISAIRSSMTLRGFSELKINEAIVLLRKYETNDRYYQKSMEETIDRSIAVWNKMEELGNIKALSLYKFDFHPTCGLYIFDDRYVIYGNLGYEKKSNKYTFEDNVILIDSSSDAGKDYIENCIKFFDGMVSNYEG